MLTDKSRLTSSWIRRLRSRTKFSASGPTPSIIGTHFQHKIESLKADSPATTETRNLWIVPLLSLLGYQLEYQARGTELNGKTYPISHRVTNRKQTPLHIIGYREPSGLDRKPEKMALRMSAHALVQEYLNLSDELYGIVTNGRLLRVLRDSSRLVKLSYLEFDLDRIFTDGLFADFAVLFRLLHATRLPKNEESAASCWLERYHQKSIDEGTRIRDGLRDAVTEALELLGTGFLAHPENTALRQQISSGELRPETYFNHLLRLVYRLLFLMVVEERGLVFPKGVSSKNVALYFQTLQCSASAPDGINARTENRALPRCLAFAVVHISAF